MDSVSAHQTRRSGPTPARDADAVARLPLVGDWRPSLSLSIAGGVGKSWRMPCLFSATRAKGRVGVDIAVLAGQKRSVDKVERKGEEWKL